MPARVRGLSTSLESRSGQRMGSGLQKRCLDVALNGPHGRTFSPATMSRTGETPPPPGAVPYKNAWFQFGPAWFPDCQKTVMRLRTGAEPLPKNIFPQTLVNARERSSNARTSVYLFPCLGAPPLHRAPGRRIRAKNAAAVSSRPLWNPAFARHAAGRPFPKNIFPQTLVNARPTHVQRSYERLPVPLPVRAASSPRARTLRRPAFAPHAAGGTLPFRHALQIPAGPGSSPPRRDVSDVATYAGWPSYSFADAGQC